MTKEWAKDKNSTMMIGSFVGYWSQTVCLYWGPADFIKTLVVYKKSKNNG